MGSAHSSAVLRTQIHALVFNQGLPSIFMTIHPADIHSRIALYFAGIDLDLDKILPQTIPSTYERAQIIAAHPVSTARFFHVLISNILRVDAPEANGTLADPYRNLNISLISRSKFFVLTPRERAFISLSNDAWTSSGPFEMTLQWAVSDEVPRAFALGVGLWQFKLNSSCELNRRTGQQFQFKWIWNELSVVGVYVAS